MTTEPKWSTPLSTPHQNGAHRTKMEHTAQKWSGQHNLRDSLPLAMPIALQGCYVRLCNIAICYIANSNVTYLVNCVVHSILVRCAPFWCGVLHFGAVCSAVLHFGSVVILSFCCYSVVLLFLFFFFKIYFQQKK